MRLCYFVLQFFLVSSIICCHATPKREHTPENKRLFAIEESKNTYLDEKEDDRHFAIYPDEEVVFVPKKLPKITKEQKLALIRESGQNATLTRPSPHHRRLKKQRRSLDRLDAPWRRYHVVGLSKPQGPPISVNIHRCPSSIDAVTQAHNRRTYAFANEYVYQIYRENGLQQKAAFLINDMFPGGPRRVTAALTNLRSGVTVLLEYKTVYRFRWNKKDQRFYLARKSPQKLIEKVDFLPRLAFQWIDGNMILTDGENFVTYDPYWNIATYNGKTLDYFPNIPSGASGLAHNGGSIFLFLTSKNTLQVYSTKKFDVVQEYPIRLEEYVACSMKI